ncbi:MAG: peptide chain release factor 1 [Verrucomicrobiales bacterium]
MDFAPLIEKRRAQLGALEEIIASPSFFNDPKNAAETTREHARIKKLLESWDEFQSVQTQIADSEELAKSDDEEMAALAAEELPELKARDEKLQLEIQYALLPRDKTEERDALVELRAGAGGDEASLFAGDLLRMYQRYCETVGWKTEILEAHPSEVGGFKEVVFKVTGDEVFRTMKYESGVHRVQRVPSTEAQGRIHTSTASVAVLPEAEEVDVQLKPEELRIETCRSGGPGGQHVNTTDSAVQVLHLPTGIMVKCQDGRSQPQNRERALQILRAKLLEAKQREEQEKYSAHRRALIGSADRAEKIRTYNFPQNRITDHRIGLTLYNLDGVLEGDLSELISALQTSEVEERLAELNLEA